MTPRMLGEIRRLCRSRGGTAPTASATLRPMRIVNTSAAPLTRDARLTTRRGMRHNYIYYGNPTKPPRCQALRSAPPRHAPSSPSVGARSAVRVPRLLRFTGFVAGEVRNAPPSGRRGGACGADGRRVWLLAPDVLSDAGRLHTARDRRTDPAETRAARRSQARRHGDGVCGDGARGGPGAQRADLAPTDSRPLWSRRAPAEPRARLAPRGKKTPLSPLPDVTSGKPETDRQS